MPDERRKELRIIALLFSILFVGVADNQVLSPILSSIRSAFGKSSSELGLLFTGYSFCAGLTVLIFGPISDAFGRKKGLLTGLSIFVAGSCISFFSASFNALLIGRIVTGMGAANLSLNCIAYAADFFPYAKRGWAMGSIVSSYFAALILGVPISSWIAEKIGWNAVFCIMGGAAFLLIIPTIMLPGITAEQSAFSIRSNIRQYSRFLQSRSLLLAFACSFFASAGISGFLSFVGIWFHDSFHVSSSGTGLVFLASGVAALIASPYAGKLSDRIGKGLQFILSSALLALLLVILPHLSWNFILFGVLGLISLSAAFRQGPLEAVLSEIAPQEARGSFIAMKNSFSQLGIGTVAWLSGILFQHIGYASVCILCSVFGILAAVAMLLAARERGL